MIHNFSDYLSKKLKKHWLYYGNYPWFGVSETAVVMMSCAKLGIHFSVIFEDLAPEAISKRIDLIKPKLFITRFEKGNLRNKYKIK